MTSALTDNASERLVRRASLGHHTAMNAIGDGNRSSGPVASETDFQGTLGRQRYVVLFLGVASHEIKVPILAAHSIGRTHSLHLGSLKLSCQL